MRPLSGVYIGEHFLKHLQQGSDLLSVDTLGDASQIELIQVANSSLSKIVLMRLAKEH